MIATDTIEDFKFQVENSTLNFLKFGQGKQLLFCIHGFAENAEFVLPIRSSLSQHFTVLSMDVAFHGKTNWLQPSEEYAEKLPGLLVDVAESLGHKQFSLLGFSMGGRIILDCIERIPERISSVILLAPAGVKLNRLKHWFSNTWIADSIAKFLHQHPAVLSKCVDWSYRMGQMDGNFYQYISERMKDPNKRIRINNIRKMMKGYQVNLPTIRKKIEDHNIGLAVVFGEGDKVIPKNHGKLLTNGIAHAEVHLVKKGHLLIDADLNETIHKILDRNGMV